MNVYLWAALVLLVIGVFGLIIAAVAKDEAVAAISGVAGVVALVLTVVTGFIGAGPEWRLHKATIEKRILVEDARAQADAAVELARAEITRAEGVAAANLIVAESITEPYLRYLYIDQLDEIQGQVIYIPTEAGLPILEANRLRGDE